MHYQRIPREEWAGRIQMAKAMGLNTISTYVFWNLHETKRGEFDFSGEKDVAAFIRECGAAGMRVIVRPGRYVCAEWELGGLPSWLLTEPEIRLRSTDLLEHRTDGWNLPARLLDEGGRGKRAGDLGAGIAQAAGAGGDQCAGIVGERGEVNEDS